MDLECSLFVLVGHLRDICSFPREVVQNVCLKEACKYNTTSAQIVAVLQRYMQSTSTASSHYWGVVYPNVYVRTLSGVASTPPPVLQLAEKHLQDAIRVLSRFDEVVILEKNFARLARFLGIHTITANTRPKRQEWVAQAALPFRQQFVEANALDYKLYSWASARI